MPTKPGSGVSTRTVDEQFLALICSEEDLLQAEFDAIIAAEWPSPPTTTPRRGPANRHPASEAHDRRRAHGARLVARPRHPGIGGWARQRSPPPPQPRNHDRKGR